MTFNGEYNMEATKDVVPTASAKGLTKYYCQVVNSYCFDLICKQDIWSGSDIALCHYTGLH